MLKLIKLKWNLDNYVALHYFDMYHLLFSYFGMDKMEKNPREIIAPEVQKELLVLEEQEVRKETKKSSHTVDS